MIFYNVVLTQEQVGLIVMEKDLELNTMTKTATAPYDVAEHLRTREEMAAY